MSWIDRAYRIRNLFSGASSDSEHRTGMLMDHILNQNNRDDYISRDFYNVQQTAGGLPEGMSFGTYLGMIQGHIRPELQGGSFDESLNDNDIRVAALAFDNNIRRHIQFLNGVVHQGAPGQVHVALWEKILADRGDSRSVYSVYQDYLVDA